jgi:hypothetical protein
MRVLLAAGLVPFVPGTGRNGSIYARCSTSLASTPAKLLRYRGQSSRLCMARTSTQTGVIVGCCWCYRRRSRTTGAVSHHTKTPRFKSFEQARFSYLPEASKYSALFVGQLEYAKRGKGYGYDKNHRVRLVLQAVRKSATDADDY